MLVMCCGFKILQLSFFFFFFFFLSSCQSPIRLSGTGQKHPTESSITASSMAELQNLLSKSSGDTGKKSSLAEKLRALQLVEELIAEQEEVVHISEGG